jgi:hypothetical protein
LDPDLPIRRTIIWLAWYLPILVQRISVDLSSEYCNTTDDSEDHKSLNPRTLSLEGFRVVLRRFSGWRGVFKIGLIFLTSTPQYTSKEDIECLYLFICGFAVVAMV